MSTKNSIRSVPALTTVAQALGGAVGAVRVRADAERSLLHVRAASTDDVRSVVAVAARYAIPVLPRAPGLDTAAITPPAEGGIVLDLSAMNRVLEINHSERYAVVEPGVSWRSLDERLLEDGADLALPVPAAPAQIGPWTSCLVDGAEGRGLALGHVGQLVWGVEAVLPSGEIVRTGVRATGEGWWGRGPHPDLTGLFGRWQGATGVVTRLSVSLTHRRRHVRRLLLPASTRRVAVAAAIRLARTGLFEETQVLPWALMRLLLGVDAPDGRHPEEPDAWLQVDFHADTFPELEYKRVRLAQALARASRRGGTFDDPLPLKSLADVSPGLDPLEDLPLCLSLDGRGVGTHGGGTRDAGLRVLGFHGPIAALVDGAGEAEAAYAARRLTPSVLVRPVPGGYHGILHVLLSTAGSQTPADLVRAAETDALDRLSALGFVTHRHPPELGELVLSRVDAGARALADRLRRALDPDGLLDPVRWGLPPPT
jgi:FAD/FMN-containing dehydrogenase